MKWLLMLVVVAVAVFGWRWLERRVQRRFQPRAPAVPSRPAARPTPSPAVTPPAAAPILQPAAAVLRALESSGLTLATLPREHGVTRRRPGRWRQWLAERSGSVLGPILARYGGRKCCLSTGSCASDSCS